jgi:hypothetical protein
MSVCLSNCGVGLSGVWGVVKPLKTYQVNNFLLTKFVAVTCALLSSHMNY